MLNRIERGALRLTMPVSELIPEFGHRGTERVTLFHLLTHTSGIVSCPRSRTHVLEHLRPRPPLAPRCTRRRADVTARRNPLISANSQTDFLIDPFVTAVIWPHGTSRVRQGCTGHLALATVVAVFTVPPRRGSPRSGGDGIHAAEPIGP